VKQALIGYGCIAVSVAAHAGVVLGSAQLPSAPPAPRLATIELTAPPPPALPPEPTPVPPPPPEPEPVAPKAQPRALSVASKPSEPTPTPAPPAPELTGQTLTGEGEAAWAAPAGNGEARSGPIQTGSAPPAPTVTRPPAPPTSATPPATQPFAELSRKPAPPPLGDVLKRNYPAQARSQGRSGEAKVRALIDAQGRVASVSITFESASGFGAACQRTLQQSRWTAPLGKRGEPTATFVSYRCRFEIED
jgi:TonB family protein